MNPNEVEETKKDRWKPAVIILAGVIAVALITGRIWGGKSQDGKIAGTVEMSDRLTEEKQVLRTDILLHSGFSRIQQLDERFGNLVSGSGSPKSIDSAGKAIAMAEELFRKTIDSVDKETTNYNAWSNVVILDSITAAFRTALDNRKYMEDIRRVVAGKPLNLTSDQQQVMMIQQELKKKNEMILNLQKQLSSGRGDAGQASASRNPETQKQVRELEQALKEEEIRSTALLDVTTGLKQENEKLTNEIQQVRRAGTSGDASIKAARTRAETLEAEVSDLEAELNFARVDCNLSRADAKKIISNSRQRKELLAEALRSLKDLSSSGNSAVQRKAKEKIVELNQIASMVRD